MTMFGYSKHINIMGVAFTTATIDCISINDQSFNKFH